MVNRAINSKLIKTLFCVVLLLSLVLYPPSSAHAHASAHGVAASQDAVTGHHGEYGAHTHNDMGDAQGNHLIDADNGTSSDTPNCCQGICMAEVITQSQLGLPDVYQGGHEPTGLSSFSPFDPIAHRRPPKHLI